MAREHRASEFQPNFGLNWRPVLTREFVKDWDNDRLAKYIALRKQVEKGAIDNPVGQGWSLPMWDKVQENWKKYRTHCILGGNRSSKSIFAARLAVWAAATIPESQIRMYHVNSERSIQDQQQMVWDALPIGIKNLPTKKGANHSLQFSQKNGFTDSICILPPLPSYRKGGSIIFGNYRQFQQDEQVAEGFKAHAIFCDEECPQKFFETLLFRTIDYDGKIFLTFTTLQGWTPLIQDILGKTKTLESTEAPLLGGRQVPLIQESLSRKETCIYYFHTASNPFIDSKSFLDTLAGRPKDEILARAYGIPTKSIAGVFPGFSREYAPAGNVIKHEDLPWLKERPKDKKGDPIPYKVTRYMAIDPAGSKNWFLVWLAIDASGTWFIYREWPDYDDWALPGNTPEGKPGPAQKGSKKGIRDYVEMIKGMEGDEEIFERYIDPRMGAAEKQSDDGATTIISDLDDADLPVIPAPGVDIENGIQLLNNLLAWDENKPRDSMNAPKLYISDRCHNVITALQEYTGLGGRGENFKDPCDCLRYLAVSDVQFIDKAQITDRMAYGHTASY